MRDPLTFLPILADFLFFPSEIPQRASGLTQTSGPDVQPWGHHVPPRTPAFVYRADPCPGWCVWTLGHGLLRT